ncbi:MAG TPA: microviridin/marinostatin family tricyclic proteinase inhibitor [Nostocaceae cyanobacterium]|nr:microviridin/marinostatin family tricyclic proteinase inhibitor [Nostocaceae cyanobacterium]
MSNIKFEDLDPSSLPFFTRFLEGQSPEELSLEETNNISGGCVVTTAKYPSDNEDSVTKKAPSDSDEFAVTLKYPSDSDEDGVLV